MEKDKQKYAIKKNSDALEEILRLVKKDQEDTATLRRARDNEKN
jgi:hypothetical protein